MSNFSIREAETLCMKAARGAGYSWGMSEEISVVAGFLIKHNLSDLGDIIDLLSQISDQGFARLVPVSSDHWEPATSEGLCPITTGCYLSDSASCEFQKVVIGRIAKPIALLGFLASISKRHGVNLQICWGHFQALVAATSIEVIRGQEEKSVMLAEQVIIEKTPRKPGSCSGDSLATRIDIEEDILARLLDYRRKTCVPETDELRTTGAGGEKVDDDE